MGREVGRVVEAGGWGAQMYLRVSKSMRDFQLMQRRVRLDSIQRREGKQERALKDHFKT